MSDSQRPIDRLYVIIDRDGLAGLTDAESGFYGIYWFVTETNNGGVGQFFFNDAGRLSVPTLRYLEDIGATKSASILRRAIAMFPGGNVPTDQEERREVLETLDDQGLSFEPLTNEFFSCGEDLNEFHIAYVRAHPELFARIRGET